MWHINRQNNKGQAVAEMAVFGSLILFVFGILLSYLQRQNDQQYVQMEGFRRAMKEACTYIDPGSDEGQGARVQMTMIENRRHADLSGDYKKGSSQTLSSSANVFWAVPPLEQDAKVPNLIAYRINQDEKVEPRGDSAQEIGDIITENNLEFNQRLQKSEDTAGITNTDSSELKETIRTVIPYSEGGAFWEVEQNLYRDENDGQYKYSSQAPDEPVKRGKVWKTGF